MARHSKAGFLRRYRGAACMALLLAARGISPAAIQTNGSVTSFTISTNGASGNRSVRFQLSPTGTVDVTPFAPDVIRVRFHFASLYDREEAAIAKPFSNWPAFSCTFTQATATNFVIQTDQLQVELVLSNRFRVHFKDLSGYDLSRDLHMEYNLDYHQNLDTNAYAQVNWPGESVSVSNVPNGFKLKAIRFMDTNEVFFGGGEWATAQNRRGQTNQFWNQDTYQWGEQRNPMYMALPFFYGAQPATNGHPSFAYGMLFNNPARPVFKFGSGDGLTYSFEAGDDQIDYFFFGGGSNHSMRAIVNRYSELTGRPTMLPKWALGYHQSRHTYFTQTDVQNIALAARTNDFPCDAVYLDIGVQSGSPPHQLTFGSSFTNVPGMINFCTNLGVQLVPLVEPLLVTNDPLYAEASNNLYFLKKNDLSTYVGTNFLGGVSWLDFSQSNFANAWWIGKLTNYLSLGFESVWNDLNEPNDNSMPLDILYFLDGKYGGGTNTGNTIKWHAINRNTYGLMESSVSYQALQTKRPNRRPFVLSRSGWPGIARYAVSWSGDNVANYNHLRFDIRLGTSVMISGQPWFGHDIGGFLGNPDSELFTRWMEWGSLTPFCRGHSDFNTSSNREPWLFPSPFKEWNRRWLKFRYELMPYLYTLAEQTATSGVPMNSPVLFEFTSDTNTWSKSEYDFLVGRHLLAAPVYLSNGLSRAAYLPAGAHWYFWQDDMRLAGGQTVTVPASLGTLPLFVREGGILPMGPAMDYANEFVPDHLDVHVWPGASNDFTMYEDDGLTTNYLAGQIARARMSQSTATNTWTFTLAARTGSYSPGARDLYVVWHAVTNVEAVTLDGAALARWANRGELETAATDGWTFAARDRRLVIKLPDTGAAHVIVARSMDQPDTDGDGIPDGWELAHLGTLTHGALTNLDADARNNLQEYEAGSDPLFSDVFVSSFTNMAVAGTFSFWNEAARNMRLVSNFQWAAVMDLAGWTNIEFKFVGNDSWSLANWGDSNQLDFAVPFNQAAEFNVTNNILASGAFTGRYTFTFNDSTLSYSLYHAGTVDSDRDGLDDAWEFDHGLNPLSHADAAEDAEGDGLSNSNEYSSGSNPVRADTDADHQTDLEEFIAGTSITNGSAFFAIASEGLSSTGVVVSWSAVTGRIYDLYFASNLSDTSAWSILPPLTNLSGSGPIAATDTNAASLRHYQLRVRKQ